MIEHRSIREVDAKILTGIRKQAKKSDFISVAN
jgi:hypothetical protein